jgi:hypothetical protein
MPEVQLWAVYMCLLAKRASVWGKKPRKWLMKAARPAVANDLDAQLAQHRSLHHRSLAQSTT